VMNALDGSGQKRLAKNAAPDALPAWSPNGKRIAFTSFRDSNDEIFVVNLNTKKQKRLTTNSVNDDVPNWQPLVNRAAPK
jgi:Tol biopolymer transport system component